MSFFVALAVLDSCVDEVAPNSRDPPASQVLELKVCILF